MGVLHRQRWCGATGLAVPLLTLASPAFLKIAGVAPSWAVLWLLPWALVDGSLSGGLAGLAVGLLLDALHPSGASLVPGLVLLGWWWGRIGRKGAPIQGSFNLALLALFGTLLLDLSLMIQWLLISWRNHAAALVPYEGSAASGSVLDRGVNPAPLALPGWHWDDLAGAGLQVLLAQTLVTALLAPLLCSLQLLLWRQLGAAWRS
ncbi:MAG: rod shape-determining protein MreD [Cyanobacteriota bacterium]